MVTQIRDLLHRLDPTQPDGQQVLIGNFADISEARKRPMAFKEYWPGDYSIEISIGDY